MLYLLSFLKTTRLRFLFTGNADTYWIIHRISRKWFCRRYPFYFVFSMVWFRHLRAHQIETMTNVRVFKIQTFIHRTHS